MANQNQTANQQGALVTSKQNLKALLEKAQVSQTLDRVSTRWLSGDQLKTQAIIAVARNPALVCCTQASFLESMVRAAELGLRFAGAGGEAYLVPFKNQCTLIVGYRGLCALARRTGKVTRIEARCVRQRDHFKVSYGSGQQLFHRPHLGSDRGEITCVYALAELRDGSVQIEVMTRAEVDAIRKRSHARDNGPWQTDYEEMCRKTALRRLCKYLPFPTSYDDALAAAEEPAKPQDQPRKRVEASDVPENIDIRTGEILDADQASANFNVDQDEAVPDPEQSQADSGATDFETKKAQLLEQINTALVNLYPGDSIESQAAKLKALNHIYGKVRLDEIAKLPTQILEAGLLAMNGQEVVGETEGDDIPV